MKLEIRHLKLSDEAKKRLEASKKEMLDLLKKGPSEEPPKLSKEDDLFLKEKRKHLFVHK